MLSQHDFVRFPAVKSLPNQWGDRLAVTGYLNMTGVDGREQKVLGDLSETACFLEEETSMCPEINKRKGVKGTGKATCTLGGLVFRVCGV